MRSVIINGRMYIFSNLSSEGASRLGGNSIIKIVDLNLRRIFSVDLTKSRNENKPSSTRVNYSMASFKNKVYLYGGMDQDSKILDSLDEFDVTTYKFNQVKFRGDFKPKGRQAHCAFAFDQYNMFVFGGTYQTNLIDPAQISDETNQILNYDMDASTFASVSLTSNDNKPQNLIFPSAF